ncbi:hypothetical protein [Roseinatronobacter bogoriensis]|uniref:Terminase n=1 Tax=Roseinatronobacter bogoriensis subsp. barguzinensis TaxID=441209 RepID=A0A2K8K9Z3_9RHOB|nr:hypothetical protein [Rhodobaca]ATX66244.1 hypothetical protein BG454_10820 [Rhodobaca barguzinensis]MBB4207361.1 hypothetical protein [Rhodobaca bogoriensis DSM 18756]TDW40332.1 hypothetical protein LY39_01367 [Rhodobaca barguzinensis]TDY70516.1 hypothetical protein EV660_102190 [Rhodobaca bogoriensis DSM 18756]
MTVTIRDAMTDPQLFGDTFAGDSFKAWRALLSGFYGLPLSDDEAAIWQQVTARTETPQEAHDELWLVVGRRGGKSHAAALLAVFEAAFKDHRDKLAAGEFATVMLIAGDRPQARTLLRYVRGLFEHPMLKPLVQRETAEGLELTNRSAIEVHTASHRAVRGYTCAAVIADELAFWFSDGARPDAEVIAAVRPALATLGGKLIALSSPYARRGMLWTTYKNRFGKAGRVLVAQAPSRTMNPTLPQRVVDDALKDDSARASAEYLAQFRSDIEAFLSVEVVDAVTRDKPLELPPVEGVTYTAFADPSGGGADEFTLSIGHREKGVTVIDLVVGRRGNPAQITEEFSEILKHYSITKVSGDRYAGAWVVERFADHGIIYQATAPARSELYLALGLAARSGQLELPPCEALAGQLVALERRTSRGGRDQIDHPPGGHDDRANACAGVVQALAQTKPAFIFEIGDSKRGAVAPAGLPETHLH